MANTTFNPSDLVNISLSGGNLTASPIGQGGVRSIAAAVDKHYFEIRFSGASGFAGAAVGIANSAANLATVITTATGAAICAGNGNISVNGTAQTGVGAFSANGSCCIALDTIGKLIWFRNGAAGNWNGSGTANPATGAGGYSFSGLTGGSAIIYAFAGGTTSLVSSTTANFGDSAFAGAVPAGFTAGFLGATAAAQVARVMVMA